MYKNYNQLKLDLADILTLFDSHLTLHDPEKLLGEPLEKLRATALLSTDETLRAKTKKIIRQLAKLRGITLASLAPLFSASQTSTFKRFTIPLFSLHEDEYAVMRMLFLQAQTQNSKAFGMIVTYKNAEALENAIVHMLTSALQTRYEGPVFLAAALPAQDDIDTTTLLETGVQNIIFSIKPTPKKNKAATVARLTRLVRHLEQLSQQHSHCLGLSITEAITQDDLATTLTQYIHHVPRKKGVQFMQICANQFLTEKQYQPKLDTTAMQKWNTEMKAGYNLPGLSLLEKDTLPVSKLHTLPKAGIVSLQITDLFQKIIHGDIPHLPGTHPGKEKAVRVDAMQPFVASLFEALGVTNTHPLVTKLYDTTHRSKR